ncbi:MAG: hypothetical protein QME46_04335 [Thermoanaerobacteraceae bacterium]|nr:hypothetical protein [Thermoanaerobacteraceae bacterium]
MQTTSGIGTFLNGKAHHRSRGASLDLDVSRRVHRCMDVAGMLI